MTTENEPKASGPGDLGPFFHGTKADLQPGDLLEPGYGSNYGAGARANFIYLTATLDAATWGAELAVGAGPGRIYRVEPHPPEVLQHMLDHLAELERRGIEAIND